MAYKNGFFQLYHKGSMTYLKLYPAMNGGKPIQMEDVIWYLDTINLLEYDKTAVGRAVRDAVEKTEVFLCNREVLPENERVRISVPPEKDKAVCRFYPPSTKGKMMSKQDILDELAMENVSFGIIEKNIDAYISARQFCVNVLMAKGKAPVEGHSAQVKFLFDTNAVSKPKINEDGSVDFHDLGNINHVSKDELLAEKIPMDIGKPGTDVFGNVIPQMKVKDCALKHGNHIRISEDGLQMFSEVSGHVSLVNDTVFVSDVYEVPADVGPSTGDIEYDGNVTVKGNVITGFTVKATGNIVVNGAVEGATLIADGDIILRNGIQGMNKGLLKAKGDVVTKFIESANVETESSIKTDAILHSNVTAKKNVIVSGKRGLITGGTVKAGDVIQAKTIGSTMGTTTNLEVGIDPALIEQCRIYEKQMEEFNAEEEKLNQMIALFRKKLAAGEKLSPEKLKVLKEAAVKKEALTAKKNELEATLNAAKEEIEQHEEGKVKVENIAYPGTKMIIGNVTFYVRSATHYCQFIREGADVVTKPM